MAGTNKSEARRPRLHYLSYVHPRLYFCRDAALMRLTNGLNRLVSRAYPPERKDLYSLYLNGAVSLLLDGHHKAAACAAEGMPDEYRTSHFSDYPEADTLEAAVELPRDQIRAKIDEMRKEERRHDYDLRTLRAYARLFPDGKWLGASERAWLDEMIGW